MDDRRIVLTGGGSGGHIYPLFAVAQSLMRTASGDPAVWTIYYMGPKDKYSEILAELNIEFRSVMQSKIRRYASGIFANILDIPKFFLGFLQALWHLFWIMPDAVFSKGGPGALPVVFAARFYGIPVMIHESDAVPGMTNLISARAASAVAVSFEKAQKYFDPSKTIVTGQPVRKELLSPPIDQSKAKEDLGFDPKLPLALVLGGSQGSARINEFIVLNLPQILGVTQVLHQTGRDNIDEMKKIVAVELKEAALKKELAARYIPAAFIDRMPLAFAAADLVISRASSTVFEIALMKKPAILIPLQESANDHQRANAYEYARSGAAVVIEEPNLLPAIFLRELSEILTRPDLSDKMKSAAAAFWRPGAADLIAQKLLELSGQRRG